MILNDQQIAELVAKHNMITPFVGHSVREVEGRKVISYGLSSFGYDIRCGYEFLVFEPADGGVVDPLNFDEKRVRRVEMAEYITIPPNSFALTHSLEYFRMPDDVLGVVQGKSTYARCGIDTNVTPLEPGWEGQVTLEISNTTPSPVKIYAGQGICQVLFFRGERPAVTYADRKGKYQGQTRITLPRG